jgi:2-phospho-L-lactate transferase/gluconeogenesis factor (CofD/UPF0052 family)
MEKYQYPQAEEPALNIIGGGGGTAAVAPHLIEAVPDVPVTVMTGTADSGSATGELRQIFATPAVGDLRRVTAALSGNQAGEIFEHRLGPEATPRDVSEAAYDLWKAIEANNPEARGRAVRVLRGMTEIAEEVQEYGRRGLYGHTIGNLALTTMITMPGRRLGESVKEASDWLGVDPRITIMPVSEDPHHLVMLDGLQTHVGEGVIDELEIRNPHNARVWLHHVEPLRDVGLYGPADRAIRSARINVLMPGSFWTSHGAILSVPGATEALQANARAGGVLAAVANLTVERDTPGFTLADYVRGLGGLAGRAIDSMVVNNNIAGLPADKAPFTYDGSPSDTDRTKYVVTDLLSETEANVGPHDPIAHLRSQVSTDGARVAKALHAHGLLAHAA